MWLLLLLLLCGLAYIFSVLHRRRRFYASLDSFPQLNCNFWNGILLVFGGTPDRLWELICGCAVSTVGSASVVCGWVLGFPYLVLSGAEEIEPLLRSRNINKSREYNVLRAWLADGLFTNNGDSWRSRRKTLTPAFHWDILDDYAQVFRSQGSILISRLREASKEGAFDIWPYFTAATLDSICETISGGHFGLQTSPESEYAKSIARLTELVQNRMQRPQLWVDWLYRLLPAGREEAACLKTVHAFADKMIDEKWVGREQCVDENGNERPKRRAFLDLLIDMVRERRLEKSELRQEVNTFIFAGHDTSSMGLNWSIFLLGHHPEVQEKVAAEISQHITEDSDWSLENVKKLVYLEAVFKESIRLYPPGPIMARTIEQEIQIKGVRIPPGTTVAFTPFTIHRDPKLWEDPERFDPERFLPPSSAHRRPFAFLPFSAGQRNCIGQRFAVTEAKIFLGMIVREFYINSVQQRHEVKAKAEVVLRPDPGIFITLRQRRTLETAL